MTAHFCIDQILAEVIQAGDETLRSEICKLTDSMK
jgi:hypothetical protein